MPSIAPSNVTLIRGLSLIAAISIVVGNVIGTGVFLKTRVMTCNVGTPGMVLGAWVAAGLLSLAGALTYAELAAMMPRAAGEYVFVREAYGPGAGFLYGWMQIFVAKTGSQAFLALQLAGFLNILTGHAFDGKFFTLSLFQHEIPFGSIQVIALLAIAIVTLINCAAVSVSGHVATVLTGVKVALVVGIGLSAFLFASGSWMHFSMAEAGGLCQDVNASARMGLLGFSAAMLGALWGYDGWNNLTLVAGEVRNPQRNIPLALIGGMLLVGTLYIFINIAYFYVLTPTEIANIPAPPASYVAMEVVKRFLGPVALSLIAAALMASSFGTLHTSILTGGRVPYAMSRDRLFFQNLARLSPKTHVPIGALIVQGLWAGVLALSGWSDALTDYVIFASWIFYGLVTASIFIFRRRMPDAERPYKAWGYPIMPIIFLLVTAGLLSFTLWTSFTQAITGLILIAIGLPVYYYFAYRNRVLYREAPDVKEE